MHIKFCEVCGKEFQAKRSDAKTCSDGCRQEKKRKKLSVTRTTKPRHRTTKQTPVTVTDSAGVTDDPMAVLMALVQMVQTQQVAQQAVVVNQDNSVQHQILEVLLRIESKLDRAPQRAMTLPGAIGSGRYYEPEDDDNPELVVKKASGDGGEAVQNFLNSLLALDK